MLHLCGDSFKSLAASLKQSSRRAKVLAGRITSKHHTRTGQTGSVEDLRTMMTNERRKQLKVRVASNITMKVLNYMRGRKSTDREHISLK